MCANIASSQSSTLGVAIRAVAEGLLGIAAQIAAHSQRCRRAGRLIECRIAGGWRHIANAQPAARVASATRAIGAIPATPTVLITARRTFQDKANRSWRAVIFLSRGTRGILVAAIQNTHRR